MKKILVTTDFSASSKSALYFAIQLASQTGYSLTFFHSYHVLVPTAWNEKVFNSFEKSELGYFQVTALPVSTCVQLTFDRAPWHRARLVTKL